MTTERVSRLGAITPEQVQAALDRFELGRFRSVTPTEGGLGRQTAFVEADSGSYVLRGNPLFEGQFEKEVFFARLLHERGPVAVPWPYHHDPGTDIFGWPYVLLPRLPGRAADVGPPSDLGPEDQRAVVSALAGTLAALHAVGWSVCGEYSGESAGIEPLPSSWSSWVAERIQGKLAEGCQG